MTGEHYHAFIKQAFLDPIRSVLIIDDDFPTLEEVLSRPRPHFGDLDAQVGKAWRNTPNLAPRIANMIQKFRHRSPPLFVDIHDGTNILADDEKVAVARLHHCDLLVLDYELEKSKPEDPTCAINILRSLMLTNHFNLVSIYTSKDLDMAFNSVRWGLIGPSKYLLSDVNKERAETLISEAEDVDEGFKAKVTDTINSEQYFLPAWSQDLLSLWKGEIIRLWHFETRLIRLIGVRRIVNSFCACF